MLHKKLSMRVVIHGDDFRVLGRERALGWLRRQISDTYEVKFGGESRAELRIIREHQHIE